MTYSKETFLRLHILWLISYKTEEDSATLLYVNFKFQNLN